MEDEFDYVMVEAGENVTFGGFCHSWDSSVVNPILDNAIQRQSSSVTNSAKKIPAFKTLILAETIEDIPMEERSEIAMLLLVFIVPANGSLKCQLKTVEQLLLQYTNVSLNDVKDDLAVRRKGHEQPVMVKLTTEGKAPEFFISFDGYLIETHAGVTKSLMMLFSCFFVFWLSYPVALTHFYRFMEYAMGIKKGLKKTPPFKAFVDELFPERRCASTQNSAVRGVDPVRHELATPSPRTSSQVLDAGASTSAKSPGLSGFMSTNEFLGTHSTPKENVPPQNAIESLMASTTAARAKRPASSTALFRLCCPPTKAAAVLSPSELSQGDADSLENEEEYDETPMIQPQHSAELV